MRARLLSLVASHAGFPCLASLRRLQVTYPEAARPGPEGCEASFEGRGDGVWVALGGWAAGALRVTACLLPRLKRGSKVGGPRHVRVAERPCP
jgi:hypothetical protein